MKECLESKRLEDGRNAQLEIYVHEAFEKINNEFEESAVQSSAGLQPSF